MLHEGNRTTLDSIGGCEEFKNKSERIAKQRNSFRGSNVSCSLHPPDKSYTEASFKTKMVSDPQLLDIK